MARLDRLGPAKEVAQFGRCPSGDEEISGHAKCGNEALGHAGKGARWFLNADQEKALRDAVTRELTRSRVRFRG